MENTSHPAAKYPFVGITLAAAFGIWLGDFAWWTWSVSLVLTVASLALWVWLRRTIPLLILILMGFSLVHSLQFEGNPARDLAKALSNGEMAVSGTGIVNSGAVESISATGRVRTSFQMRACELTTEEGRKIGPLSILIRCPESGLKLGDQISFEGNLFNLESPRNPGEFDYSAWLARKQIFSAVSVTSARNMQILQVGSGWNIRRWAIDLREKLARIITRDLEKDPVEAGVISAMMLGTSEDTGQATKELFLRTGTLHLFSVSGLHVSMLAAITLFVLLMLRVPRRTALLLTIPIVFAYALVTGWSASSVRAALMTAGFVIAVLLDRPSLSINTLAVSCFLILLFDTNQLFATGFQLSFLVVAAIVLFCGPITHRLQTMVRPDPFIPKKLLTPFQKSRWHFAGMFMSSLGLTIAAWLGSLPLTAYYFNLLSPVALLANLVIIPLSFVVLALGVVSIAASMVSGWISVIFNNANWGVVKILLAGLGLFAAVPGGSLFVGPSWWQKSSLQRLTIFDLGSGGAMIIEAGSACWLVDCGSDSDYRRVVRRYLQQRGINRVDGIFLTHGDGSHVGGIGQFQLDFPKAKIFLPEAGRNSRVFRKLIAGNSAQWVEVGDSVSISPEIRADILWPPAEVDSARADDSCLVVKLGISGKAFLLLGDTGFTAEAELLHRSVKDSLKADWIITGRNRVDPGGSKLLLQETGAKTIISTGVKFPSGEQIPQTLIEMCDQLKIRLIRMDASGAVKIKIQKEKTLVETYL